MNEWNTGLELLCHQKLRRFLSSHRGEGAQQHTALPCEPNLIPTFPPSGQFTGQMQSTQTLLFYRLPYLLGGCPRQGSVHSFVRICLIGGLSQTPYWRVGDTSLRTGIPCGPSNSRDLARSHFLWEEGIDGSWAAFEPLLRLSASESILSLPLHTPKSISVFLPLSSPCIYHRYT